MAKATIARAEREMPEAFAPLAAALSHDLSLPVVQGPVPLRKGRQKFVSRTDVTLSKKFTTPQSFKLVALSCLRHWALNRDAVIAGDPEGVHQMRVGLRRMRAALSIFKELADDEQTEELKSELKWLTGQLAQARETSVFLDETLKPQRRREAGLRGLAVLEHHIEDMRTEGLQKARSAVESPRFSMLVQRMFHWILDGHWTRRKPSAKALGTPRAFARRALAKRAKKIVKKLDGVEQLDDQRRHKLRISVKKLHYAVEFFATLFPARESTRKRFLRILKDIQDCMGRLNDFRTHRGYSGVLIRTPAKPQAALDEVFALGYVAGEARSEADTLLKSIRKGGRRLSNTSRFW
jgi:triphosphatase